MIYPIKHLSRDIPVGIQTETGVEAIGFDMKPWMDEFEDLSFSIWATRPGENAAYPVEGVELIGTVLYWHPNGVDTAIAGNGKVEILGLTSDKRKLSGWCETNVKATSLAVTQEVPEAARPWVDEVLGAAEEAKKQADRAEEIADRLVGEKATGVVRYDQEQNLSEEEKALVRQNIGAGTGGEVTTDKTLTQENTAADAKATGDRLAALSEEMAGMGAIIDLTVLPETGEKKQLYRLLTGTFYWNGGAFNANTCEIVETLPETGEPATNADMSTVYMYYSLETKAVMGYIPADLGAGLGIPAGWYPAEQLFPVANITYGGVVLSPKDASADETMYVVLEGTLYEYSDRWVALNQVGWRGDGNSAEIFNSLQNVANGNFSHAEGFRTIAGSVGSHAEGYNTTASGSSSHAEGNSTIAAGAYQHVHGSYNIEDTEKDAGSNRHKYIHIVGNGNNEQNRSNAHTLDWSGNAWYQGTVESAGMLLTSSNGTRYRFTVSDDGTLTATVVTE